MAVYYKPQSPIQSGEDFIYPITTADQVILSDGSRLEKNGAVNLVTLPTTEETPGEAPSINAGTFGGMTVSQFVEMIYPIGSIYISASATSPETLFGGTWAQINGRFLIGTGTPENNDDGTSPGSYDFAAGSKGGEADHTLTLNEIPNHNHASAHGYHNVAAGTDRQVLSNYYIGEDDYSGNSTSYIGGNAAHNNMPPYLAVYMWQRTA